MNIEKLIGELTFKAVRSSGPGGQHVNKTSSKVEIGFNIENSEAFSETEKERLCEKLVTKITSEKTLTISCSETRSQHRNKALGIEKLVELLQQNLKVAKPRKKTKPSKSVIERRLASKKTTALKKTNRRPPNQD